METMNRIWESLVNFLKEYDIAKIAEVIRGIKWQEVLTNPLAWLGAVIFLAYMLWKRQVRYLVLMVSIVLFVVLLHYTLPPSGESMSLDRLLKFMGGAITLIGVNAYFFLIRE